MSARIVDTNVLIVANGKAEHASLSCYSCCIEALNEARQQLIVIDDAFQIFGEYQHKVNPSGQPRVGDAFLLWLLQNWANPSYCEVVTLTPNAHNSFEEFPDDPDLADFDPSDHKFVAAANASINTPAILNAVDSD
ncbi:MAG: hypothetical protein ACRYFS_24320 [Janthinobacterium lividum]